MLFLSKATLSHNKIVSETIGLRHKKVVASIIYAPADRFFRIELSRVTEATTCGLLIILLSSTTDES